MKRLACLLALTLVLIASLPVEAIASAADPLASATPAPLLASATPAPALETAAPTASLDPGGWASAYAGAVQSMELSLTDSAALAGVYRTFSSMTGFRDSDGFALLARALIEIDNDSFASAKDRLGTLRDSNFAAALAGTGIPLPEALIGYCEGRIFEGGGSYFEAYQAYVDSGALDSLTRAAGIRSDMADALYAQACGFEAQGDLERAVEVFGVLDGYSDSQERLSGIMAQLSAPKEDEKASGGSTMYVVNCYSYVSLREWPASSAPALDRISRLDTVEFLDVYDSTYYHVMYNGVEGYVLAYYLSRDPDSAPAPTPAPVVARRTGRDYPKNATLIVVDCDDSITLRDQPATWAAAVIEIPRGDAVTYLNSMDNGFYEVIYHGHTGYALSRYLADEGYDGLGYDYGYGFEYGDLLIVVNCDDHISLRERPDPQANRVTTIGLKEVVTYLGPAKNGFCEIEYAGMTGYALLSYLSR
jgi:hypothetical protein